jgi:hypothetical protein
VAYHDFREYNKGFGGLHKHPRKGMVAFSEGLREDSARVKIFKIRLPGGTKNKNKLKTNFSSPNRKDF